MKHLKAIFLFSFFIVLMCPLTAFPVSVDKIAFESEKGMVVDGNEAFLISPVLVYINLLDISTGRLDRLTLESVTIAPDVDIAFTRDSNKAFLPLTDSIAVIDISSKRVHEVAARSKVFAFDKHIVKTSGCGKVLLNQLINNPELKVDINRDAAFTPDCAKAILLSSANTSVVIVDITSEKVEMLRLEDVVIRPDSKVSISPDGDTAFFLSYPYNTDNLLYGYGVSDSGSECVICDLFVPVSGPMGNVTWNKVGSNIGGGSNPPYVLPYVPSKYVDPPVSDVPDGGEGDITVPDEDSEPDPTETDDGDPEPDNTNNGEANLDPNNLSDPNNYNLNPPPIPPVPDNGDFYPPTVPGYDDSVTPIPEPRTLILLSSGLIGLIWLIRKLKTEN